MPERPRKSGLAFGDEPKSKGPEDKGLDTVASSGLAGAASSIGGILGGIAKGAVEGFTMAAATIGEPPAKADGQPVTDKTMPEPKPAGEAAAAAPKPAQPRPKPPTRTPPASHSSMGTAVTGSAEDPIAAAVASVTHDAQKKKKD